MRDRSRLAIVTGTSSGIGLALAEALLARRWRVVGLARREAPIADDRYRHVTADLSGLDRLLATMETELAPALAEPGLDRVALVNNAAMIGALTWLRALEPEHLGRMFAVNAAAPMALMALVAKLIRSPVRLRVVNISSGAAHSPFPGLADYSATKAALRLAGRSLAAEFAEEGRAPHDAAVLSYEPGLVDTAMQDRARATAPEEFPAHEAFRQFAAEDRLNPPDAVVGGIVAFLESDPREQFSERRFGDD